jgi:hypothetical protein
MRSSPLRIAAALTLSVLPGGRVNTISIYSHAAWSESAGAFGSAWAAASRMAPAPGAPALSCSCGRRLNSSGQDYWITELDGYDGRVGRGDSIAIISECLRPPAVRRCPAGFPDRMRPRQHSASRQAASAAEIRCVPTPPAPRSGRPDVTTGIGKASRSWAAPSSFGLTATRAREKERDQCPVVRTIPRRDSRRRAAARPPCCRTECAVASRQQARLTPQAVLSTARS